MADDVERAASDVLKAMGACAAKDHRACQDKQQKMRTLIAAAEARGREQPVCDCHTWPTQKELHDYTMAVEAERDAALLLAGEALELVNTAMANSRVLTWKGIACKSDALALLARPDAQAALAKWREQQ